MTVRYTNNETSTKSDAADGSFRLWDTLFLLGALGFSCYMGWVYVIYYSPALLPVDTFSQQTAQLCRMTLLVALPIVLLITGKAGAHLSSTGGRRFLLIGALALSSANALPLLFPSITTYINLYVLWGLSGVGYVLLLLFWSPFLLAVGQDRVLFFSAGITIGAALVYLIASYLQPFPAVIFSALLPVVSCLLAHTIYFIMRRRAQRVMRTSEESNPIAFPPTAQNNQIPLAQQLTSLRISSSAQPSELEPIQARMVAHAFEPTSEQRIPRDKISFRSIFLTWVYSIGLGFAAFYGTLQVVQPTSTLVFGFSIILAGIVVSVMFFRSGSFRFEPLLKYFLPLSAIGLFPMIFLNPASSLPCVGFLICLFTAYGIINLSFLARIGTSRSIQPLKVFSYGRLGNALGMFTGWVISYIAFTFGAWSSLSVAAVVVGTILIFILSKTFVFDDTDFTTEAILGVDIPRPHRNESGKGGGLFILKCRKIAEISDLSPRQSEVLILLAKGRNAEHIQHRLVISNHTAKAHIYNIYRKLNVHSQQELIDLIESMTL